jgi:hypothetical protein
MPTLAAACYPIIPGRCQQGYLIIAHGIPIIKAIYARITIPLWLVLGSRPYSSHFTRSRLATVVPMGRAVRHLIPD